MPVTRIFALISSSAGAPCCSTAGPSIRYAASRYGCTWMYSYFPFCSCEIAQVVLDLVDPARYWRRSRPFIPEAGCFSTVVIFVSGHARLPGDLHQQTRTCSAAGSGGSSGRVGVSVRNFSYRAASRLFRVVQSLMKSTTMMPPMSRAGIAASATSVTAHRGFTAEGVDFS